MSAKQWFKIRAAAEKDKPVEILIYDQIGKDWFGGDGVSAKEFAEALKEIDAKQEILVSINSPGGNVFDGVAIYHQLKSRHDFVTCRVDGLAASIASVIALAGKSLEMPKNSLYMVHDPSGMVVGTAEDMEKMADLLGKTADVMAGIYAGKTGKTREEMRDMMRAETWMTGTEANAAGFCDTVTDEIQIAASFNFPDFRRLPASLRMSAQLTPPASTAGQNTKQSMNKTAILALLTKHGKTIAADASDEIILAALTDLVTAGKITQPEAEKLKAPEAPSVMLTAAQFHTLQSQLSLEKERRIRGEIAAIAAERPWITVEEWLPRAMADESVLIPLRAMPVYTNSTTPIRPGAASNDGSTMVEAYRKLEPGPARKLFALDNWNSLEHAMEQNKVMQMSSLSVHEQLRRMQQPRAANTYSASLVTDRLADAIVTTLGTKLSALKAFSRDFGVDRLKPLATVQVRKMDSTAATSKNITDFEISTIVSTNVAVTVDHYSQPWSVLSSELNKGHQLMDAAEKSAQTFANGLNDVWTALLLTATYGAATSIGAAATFDADDLAAIYALAKNYGQKNLILDGGHLAYLLPKDKFAFRLGEQGAYGFDLIAECNRWTSAAANTVGIICDPQGLAVCSGLPVDLPASEYIELGTVTLPSLGLTVGLCHWFSKQGRSHFMSYDIMFGAKAADTTALEILTT